MLRQRNFENGSAVDFVRECLSFQSAEEDFESKKVCEAFWNSEINLLNLSFCCCICADHSSIATLISCRNLWQTGILLTKHSGRQKCHAKHHLETRYITPTKTTVQPWKRCSQKKKRSWSAPNFKPPSLSFHALYSSLRVFYLTKNFWPPHNTHQFFGYQNLPSIGLHNPRHQQEGQPRVNKTEILGLVTFDGRWFLKNLCQLSCIGLWWSVTKLVFGS